MRKVSFFFTLFVLLSSTSKAYTLIDPLTEDVLEYKGQSLYERTRSYFELVLEDSAKQARLNRIIFAEFESLWKPSGKLEKHLDSVFKGQILPALKQNPDRQWAQKLLGSFTYKIATRDYRMVAYRGDFLTFTVVIKGSRELWNGASDKFEFSILRCLDIEGEQFLNPATNILPGQQKVFSSLFLARARSHLHRAKRTIYQLSEEHIRTPSMVVFPTGPGFHVHVADALLNTETGLYEPMNLFFKTEEIQPFVRKIFLRLKTWTAPTSLTDIGPTYFDSDNEYYGNFHIHTFFQEDSFGIGQKPFVLLHCSNDKPLDSSAIAKYSRVWYTNVSDAKLDALQLKYPSTVVRDWPKKSTTYYKGRLIVEDFTWPERPDFTKAYTYNKQGNLIVEQHGMAYTYYRTYAGNKVFHCTLYTTNRDFKSDQPMVYHFENGKVVERTYQLKSTRYRYDAKGRLYFHFEVEQPENGVGRIFDEKGRLAFVTRGNQRTLYFTYDDANRLIEKREDPGYVRYGYDDRGRPAYISLYENYRYHHYTFVYPE